MSANLLPLLPFRHLRPLHLRPRRQGGTEVKKQKGEIAMCLFNKMHTYCMHFYFVVLYILYEKFKVNI